MLRYLSSGESHGKGLVVTLDGLPSNIPVSIDEINNELWRRQQGYGRGGRQKIESDTVEILTGVRHGKTFGAPITLFVENKDFANWQESMAAEPSKAKVDIVTKLRPGHADYAGVVKYYQEDIRNILERSSARATAAQVALGSVCKQFLAQFKISITSSVVSVADVAVHNDVLNKEAQNRIDVAKEAGDSLGGIVEVVVHNPPIGLGSHVQHDRKLDGALAGALMSVQAVKGVEFGLGFEAARLPGSQVHDALFLDHGQIKHKTNNAGGIEGGMTNGESIVVRVAFKPIPTMTTPLPTVDWKTRKIVEAHVERSDVCAIEAAAVIAESVTAFEIAKAFLDKFGGDSLEEVTAHFLALQK